ncbi:hypothetical protein, partial [Longimicrobium sp.]|uniref:hypothetical protein n=1 Tax=Longimicrobium sp. TaxID=2029185 RepID=UPI002F94B5BE
MACIAVLSAALLAPRAASAQDAPERSTALSLRPFGQPTIGVWHMVSPRLEVGIEAGATIGSGTDQDENEQNLMSFTLAPGVKLFGAGQGDLRPYGFAGAFLASHRSEAGEFGEISSGALGATAGIGLEWSPVARVRVGGHAGVQGAL